MSEYGPTFTNWDQTPSRATGGKQVDRGKRSPAATDLHITFNKGGVQVKDKGKEANRWEYDDDRENGVTLTFPAGSPINSSSFISPAKLGPNGDVTPPTQSLPGCSTTPTFTHPDPKFPGIKEWYWTFRNERCSAIFRGDPQPAAMRPRSRGE